MKDLAIAYSIRMKNKKKAQQKAILDADKVKAPPLAQHEEEADAKTIVEMMRNKKLASMPKPEIEEDEDFLSFEEPEEDDLFSLEDEEPEAVVPNRRQALTKIMGKISTQQQQAQRAE